LSITDLSVFVNDTRHSQPSVSIIVPTYQRAGYLPHLFDALARQVYPSNRLELIVVDNSSTDDTEDVVRCWRTVLPFPVRFHRKENNGPAASRNVGAKLANGDVVVFTDSDCVPTPHWMPNAIREIRAGAEVVCGPMIGLVRAGDGAVQFKQTPSDDGTYPSGNMWFVREWFDKLGGFNERFGIYPWGGLVAGEDTDLAWRAKRAGADLRWAANAIVGHQPAPPPTTTEILLQPVIVQIIPRLVRSIPELRVTRLWKHYFLDEEHFRFDVAAVGIVAAISTRRPVLLLLALPWLATIKPGLVAQFNRGGLRAAGRYLAIKLHGSVGDAAVLTFASVRYRRLVL
jgi:GT2 family glycosyltransferase